MNPEFNIDNFSKILAENVLLKSDNEILRKKSRENDKKYLKVIEEKNKTIKDLQSKLSAYESKQMDIFGG